MTKRSEGRNDPTGEIIRIKKSLTLCGEQAFLMVFRDSGFPGFIFPRNRQIRTGSDLFGFHIESFFVSFSHGEGFTGKDAEGFHILKEGVFINFGKEKADGIRR